MQVIPLSAKLLGYSGVLPFAVLAVLHFQQEQQIELVALKGFIAYGAIISRHNDLFTHARMKHAWRPGL
jgi:hypothetical protein